MPLQDPALQYHRAWVTIGPRDFKKSCDFYQQLLGKEPDRTLERSGHRIYAEFHLDMGFTLGIYSPQHPQANGTSNLSLCFQVEDLEAAIELVTHLGYPPPGEIAIPSHGREIYAFDPDGNRLILYQKN